MEAEPFLFLIQYMSLLKIMEKYNLDETHLDVIATSMMEGLNLTETNNRLNIGLNADQLFAVSSLFSETEFGESIDEFAPAMVVEKIEINELRQVDTIKKIITTQELRKRRAIAEDMLLLQAEKLLKNR